jgi:hypothetical protein
LTAAEGNEGVPKHRHATPGKLSVKTMRARHGIEEECEEE